ncbi:hypothetical protein VTK56DRAFT_1600 [Thermocarpiscus australiensis]
MDELSKIQSAKLKQPLSLGENLSKYDPPLPGDGEQHENGPVVPEQAGESVAGVPSLTHDESNNDRKLADSKPSVQPSIQPPTSQSRQKLHHSIGRRQRWGTDNGEDRSPIEDSVTEYDRDDIIRPPYRKRRGISTVTVATGRTASQRQTRPDRGDSSSRDARRSSRRPRRQGKRGAARPPPSRESTLERGSETDRAAAAAFEEWPLADAVF